MGRARGAVFAVFLAMDDDDAALANEAARIASVGGLAEVAARCVHEGEEAELLDRDSYYLGRVACDGSIAWGI